MAVAVMVARDVESADEEAYESLPSLRTACPARAPRPIPIPGLPQLLMLGRLAMQGRQILPYTRFPCWHLPRQSSVPRSVPFEDLAFTYASTGSITTWAWDFGDGKTSTEQNPSHTYQQRGSYTVSLSVTGPGGTNTLIQPSYITVTNSGPQ